MVAVTRYMNAVPGQYSSALACLRDTVAGEGPGALYRCSTVQYITGAVQYSAAQGVHCQLQPPGLLEHRPVALLRTDQTGCG